jgi:hypothetical protein
MALRGKMLLVAVLVAVPVTALHAMSVATFLQKAEALEKKGAMALLSRDLGRLKSEMQTAGASLKAEREAAQRAGQPPAYCPPASGASLNSNELLAHFRAIPPAQRERMHVRDGLRSLMVRKFPCPA